MQGDPFDFFLQYHKSTSIQQEPEFITSKHYRKAMEVYISARLICKHTICCWPTTSNNVSINYHNSVKGGMKAIGCTVLSAQYWCSNGNLNNLWRKIQSTLPRSNLHKSNNRLSRRSIQVLFSLYSIVFNPS